MPLCKWIRTSVVGLATTGLLIPAPCLFGQTVSPGSAKIAQGTVELLDVSLTTGNVLHGFTVDNAGRVVDGMHVFLFRDQQLVASGLSNSQGAFAIGNVRGGVYQLAAGDRVVALRCWAPETAPPHAESSTLLQITDVHRGQINPAMCALGNPWVVAGIVAAAIAIPLAIKANSDDRDDGS